MEFKQKIAKPTMPDFIHLVRKPGRKEDGISFDNGIPIKDLSKEQAEEYADLMRKTFIEHWQNSLPTSCDVGTR